MVFGLGGIDLNVIQGAEMVGANMIVGMDVNPGREQMARELGMTHFVNPKEIKGDVVAHLVELTGAGVDRFRSSRIRGGAETLAGIRPDRAHFSVRTSEVHG